jgi:predicted unusual protein kinase regulating ubiquinone biosynthesis (AarF/ABC1/UbiB family)
MTSFLRGLSKIIQSVECLFFLRFVYQDESLDHQWQFEQRIRQLGIVFIKLAQWYASFAQEKDKHWFQICMKFQIQSYPSSPFPFCYRDHDFFRIKQNEEPIDWERVECIASGSIGSVYRIKEYVVKIQHPWVAKDFEVFVEVFQWMKWIFWFFQKSVNIQDIYDILVSQFDFCLEAENMEFYRECYKNESHYIIIPRVYHVETTMLITEYIQTTKKIESFSERIERFVVLKSWVLDQIILRQVLHGDLHEGNWAFTEKGIVLFDFGYLFRIQSFSKELYSQMLSNDPVSISNALLTLFEIDVCHQPTIIQWIRDFKKTQGKESMNFTLILDILKMFVFQKMVIMNKRLFFLFNLMMIMRTIHESIPSLKDPTTNYCRSILQKKNLLQDFRTQILSCPPTP